MILAILLMGVILIAYIGMRSPGDNPPVTTIPISYQGHLDTENRIRDIIQNESRIGEPDRTDIAKAIINHSLQSGFDPLLITAICFQESRFDRTKRGSSGEYGIMQIMPDTYREVLRLNPSLVHLPETTLWNVDWNIRIGTLYLKRCFARVVIDFKNLALRPEFKGQPIRAALYAYNAGFRAGNPRGIQYQNEVMGHYDRFKGV